MTHLEIVRKLIGSIQPAGKSEIDEKRYKNLQEMCILVDALLSDINDIVQYNKHNNQASVKKMVEFAKKFLSEQLNQNSN